MLSVLVSTISNSQVFLLKKCEQLLQMQKLLTFFFSAKILAYKPYLKIKILTIRLLTTSLDFEQLGPDVQSIVSLMSS